MGDVARCSMHNEDLLYRLFGINAELLIDHSWGWEPTTISDVKAYKPESNSLGSGQVLQSPYTFDKAKLVIREMTEALVLDLVEKGLVTDKMTITIGYDIENLTRPEIRRQYHGPTTKDPYGRETPKHAHGTTNLKKPTSSTRLITEAVTELFDRIVNPVLLVRRLNVVAERVVGEDNVKNNDAPVQLELFTDYEALEREQQAEEELIKRERNIQEAMLDIKRRYGKNAIHKGTSLEDNVIKITISPKLSLHRNM